MEIVTSNKGKEKLISNGYSFVVDIKKENVFYWGCVKRKEYKCKGRVVTEFVNEIHKPKKVSNVHNHDPLAYEIEVNKANNYIKNNAGTSNLPPSQIIRNAVVSTPANIRPYLPDKRAQTAKVNRVRATTVLTEPQCLTNIKIPDDLKMLEGELFVLSESQFNGEKNIILGKNNYNIFF